MTVTRYKMVVAYDGTDYAGFQVQKNGRTVQGEIEKALQTMSKGEFIRIHGAGRTDAGVHAKGQVIHFDYPGEIAAEGMQKALNALTDKEIAIVDAEVVDESFHARFLAKGKKYQYRIDNRKVANPLTRRYMYHHRYPMKIKETKEALSYLVGTHDFTSFTSVHSEVEDKVRTIVEASVDVDEEENEWVFTFVGDGFLYNMIRIIMGTIVEVADGRRKAEEIPLILEAKDREKAGITLNPEGLCMMEVYYDEEALHHKEN
jgi:tRNA pseudouridine38-40 synthase